MKLTAAQKRLITESKVAVSDNEITSLIHHCDDAIEALKQGKSEALMASLKDLKELSILISKRLSPQELREV
jgi:hypothetical protein